MKPQMQRYEFGEKRSNRENLVHLNTQTHIHTLTIQETVAKLEKKEKERVKKRRRK